MFAEEAIAGSLREPCCRLTHPASWDSRHARDHDFSHSAGYSAGTLEEAAGSIERALSYRCPGDHATVTGVMTGLTGVRLLMILSPHRCFRVTRQLSPPVMPVEDVGLESAREQRFSSCSNL